MIVAAAGPDQQPAAGVRRRGACSGCVWDPVTGDEPGIVGHALFLAVEINLLLAFFNLIPVPPLDGGNVMLGLLPPRLAVDLRAAAAVRVPRALRADVHRRWPSAFISPPTNFLMRILIP